MTTGAGGEQPLELEEAAIEADLRQYTAGLDLAGSDAPSAVWHAFIEHAGRPLAFGSTFDDHPDNDQLSFETTLRAEMVIVSLRRDIGVVHVGEGYWGTIAALWGLKVARDEHWPTDGERRIAGHGITSNGLQAFRREVEASEVFAALLESRIIELSAMAYYV
jgi:hypothetical protein